jgi:hypothetical protein
VGTWTWIAALLTRGQFRDFIQMADDDDAHGASKMNT